MSLILLGTRKNSRNDDLTFQNKMFMSAYEYFCQFGTIIDVSKKYFGQGGFISAYRRGQHLFLKDLLKL